MIRTEPACRFDGGELTNLGCRAFNRDREQMRATLHSPHGGKGKEDATGD